MIVPSLRVHLDVHICGLGIELGPIPIRPWYSNDHNSNSIIWMTIAFPFGTVRNSQFNSLLDVQKEDIGISHPSDTLLGQAEA